MIVPGSAVDASFFPHSLSGLGATVYALALAIISLALLFAGRSVIKAVVFLAGGLAAATIGLAAGGILLGPVGAIAGGFIGFVIGGAMGVLLVPVGLGLALGYFAYLSTRFLAHSEILAVSVGVVLFFVGVAASTRILELVTAMVGGVIMYGVVVFFGAPPAAAGAISLVLTVAGYLTQRGQQRARGGPQA